MEILLSNYVFIRPISVRSGLHLLNIECVQPSADFFSLSKEEVVVQQKMKVEAVERETMLRTAAMRESERKGAKRKYKYCFIRVRFPDKILQGTFSVYEDISQVFEFVKDCLLTPRPFLLYSGRTRLDQERGGSLQELGLVPASLLTWRPGSEADQSDPGSYLNPWLRTQ